MPFTLWRATLADMLRLAALSTAVLVMVIALAATVKPLSDGALRAADLLRFVGLMVVPMMAYALPFAAGFASTLVYHRIAAEREAIAAYAAGISHKSLVFPALVGAVCAGLMLAALTHQIIPGFLQAAQRLITVDVARLLTQEIERGKSVRLSRDTMVWADAVQALKPEPGVSAQLLLKNFAAVEMKQGEPELEITASDAQLWVVPDADNDDQAVVVLRLRNVVLMREGSGRGETRDTVDAAWPVSNTFRDSPKYLTWGQLRELRERPEEINWIDSRRRDLAYALAEKRAQMAIAAACEAGELTLRDDGGRAVVVRGARLGATPDGPALLPAPGRSDLEVEVPRATSGSRGRTLITTGAVRIATDTGPGRLERGFEIRLLIEGGRSREIAADGTVGEGGERSAVRLAGLTLPEDPVAPLLAQNSAQLLAEAERVTGGQKDGLIEPKAKELSRKLDDLRRNIFAKEQERLAMSVSCAVMMLTGAITALRLSMHQPLLVYLWTFFPALISLVTISGGTPMVADGGPAGLLLMWGGVTGLAAYTAFMYMKLIRH